MGRMPEVLFVIEWCPWT